MFPKPKRVIDNDYIEWIKNLKCWIRDTPFPDPHHINEPGHGGMGTKCNDSRAIPLSHGLHQELHQIGQETFASKYSLDYESIIVELNKAYEEIANG